MKTPHKLLIIISLLACIAMFFLQSCTYEKKLAKWCARCPTHDSTIVEIKETLKDTTIYLPDDEAMATALIECDSLHQLIISELYDSLGHYVKASLSFKPQGVKYRVVSRCNVDSPGIYFAWKERDTTTLHTTTIQVPTYIEAKLTWWQKFKVNYGGYALGIIGLFLLYLLIRLGWFIFKMTPYGAAFNVPSWAGKFLK